MQRFVLTPMQCINAGDCGPKAKNLAAMLALGVSVPPYVVLPGGTLKTLSQDATHWAEIQAELHQKLPGGPFAVRSAALTEDTTALSQAGQFSTQLNVAQGGLLSAIQAVMADAVQKKVEPNAFSIIIQQYIAPDSSGVIFTRSPNGGREMVLEYGRGAGAVVGGTNRPSQYRLYRQQELPRISGLPLQQLVDTALDIEHLFSAPQDIEWCRRGRDIFWLQSRPITTLNAKRVADMQSLEKVLPVHQFFYYAKTEITEIAPHPCALTYSLLQKIYATGGPVDQAYDELDIRYERQPQLRLILGQLYIDKEAELQSLLPSFSYEQYGSRPSLQRWRGLSRTLHNLMNIAAIKPDNYNDGIKKRLADLLSAPLNPADSKTAQTLFLKQYSIVVLTNILATQALQKLRKNLKGTVGTVESVLAAEASFMAEPTLSLPEEANNWRGNALDIADESDFVAADFGQQKIDQPDWWQALPEAKKRKLTPLAVSACEWNRLREYSRWLTVRLVNMLRDALQSEFSDTSVYDCTLDELTGSLPPVSVLEQRSEERKKAAQSSLPAVLRSQWLISDNRQSGVSPGQATGVLQTLDQLTDKTSRPILWTPVLEPNLTRYFDQIGGIICPVGGLLSHLAIVAREAGIPVIVGADETVGSRLGETVSINGSTGEILFS